ncbi:hypothetical protein ACFQL4_12690 [Halosimplex aquaticum]
MLPRCRRRYRRHRRQRLRFRRRRRLPGPVAALGFLEVGRVTAAAPTHPRAAGQNDEHDHEYR